MSYAPQVLSRALVALGLACARRPRAAFALAFVICGLLTALGLTAPVDLSFTGIVSRDDPRIARYFEVGRELNFGGRMLALVEGDEARLDGGLAALAGALEARDDVARVILAPGEAWWRSRAPWLVDAPTFDAWLAVARDPADAASAEALRAALEVEEARAAGLRVEGARLVLVELSQDPLERPMGDARLLSLEGDADAALAPHGADASVTGFAAIGAQDQERTLGRVRLLTPLSLALVLLVIRRVEPRPLHLAAVAAPMLLAVGATLGVMRLIAGGLTVAEVFFGVMVFGLGVDFAVHLIARMREERAAGGEVEEALTRALAGTGPGVVAGAMTTAGAFGIVALAPDPMALHLGLSGWVGLTICLILMLTLLPAAWSRLERGGRPPPAPLEVPLVDRLARLGAARPRLVAGLALAAVVAALAGVPRFHFETDLTRVFNRQVPALAVADRVEALFGASAAPWVLPVDDLEAARRVSAALEGDPRFSRIESVAPLLRADRAERAARLAAAAPEIARTRRGLSGPMLLAGGPRSADRRALLGAVTDLEIAHRDGPPTLETLPESLRAQLLRPDGRPLVFLHSSDPGMDGLRAQQERLAVEAVHPGVTGSGALLEATMLADRPWLPWIFAGIMSFVCVLLAVDLRRPQLVALALAPVVFGTSVTFGLLCWFGPGFNVMSALVVPLLIGLGVDDGIHVVHRLREQPGDPAAAAGGVGRAIAMTTTTTCASFLMLLFTDHPGMESMAQVVLVGLPLCLLASAALIPALVTLRPLKA